MTTENRRALEYLEIRGYYSTSYTQIVQPERILAVTDYFRRYWVPLLKPGPAWLVVALRQRCFWNGQRDWCVVSRDTLARESGVAVRTADNYLDLPLVDRFVTGRQPRYTRTSQGAKRRDWTHYDVRLDEPLTPAHQAALASLATEMAAGCPSADPLACALQIAQNLLDLQPADLLTRLDQPMTRGSDSCSSLTIQQIIESAATNPTSRRSPSSQGGDSSQHHADPAPPGEGTASNIQALTRACDALYTRIVRPDKVQIATQYFRLRWLPLLGATRAWLILHLRARCYLNTQDLELRDIAKVAGLAELAAALGVSLSTVKTCLTEPPAATFLTHLATHRPAAGRVEMRFRVEMIDPLTPDDRQLHADLSALAAAPAGQQPNLAGSSPDQQPESAASPPYQETESAPIPDQRPESAASPSVQQPDPAAIYDQANGQNLHNTKALLITPESMNTHQHQVLIPAGRENWALAAAAGPLFDLLTALQIQEPMRSRIVALNPTPTAILAWALGALSSNRIENKPGFLASMLLSAYAPPPDLEQLVRLPVSDWRLLAEACLEARTTGHAELPPHLYPHFEALYTRFGHLSPSHWPILLPEIAEEGDRQEAAEEEADPDAPAPVDAVVKAGEVWGSVLADLRTQMDPSTFSAWLKGTEVIRVDGSRWTIAVRNQTAADWLEHRLLPVIRRTLHRIAGEPIEIEFEAES